MVYYIRNSDSLEQTRGIYWSPLSFHPISEARKLKKGQNLYAALEEGVEPNREELAAIQSEPLRLSDHPRKLKRIPDCIGTIPYVISKAAIDIIQSFQTTGMSFIPIDLLDQARGTLHRTHSIFLLYERIDCIDYEKTWGDVTIAAKRGYKPAIGSTFYLREPPKAQHIWRSTGEPNTHFISDELRNALYHSVTGWSFIKCRIS